MNFKMLLLVIAPTLALVCQHAHAQTDAPRSEKARADVKAETTSKQGETKRVSGAGKVDEPHAGAQRERMKACKQEADSRKLRGDERKRFMNDCLKG